MRRRAGAIVFLFCLCTWTCSLTSAFLAARRKPAPLVPWSSAIRITLPRNAKVGAKVGRVGLPANVQRAVFRLKSSAELPVSIESYSGELFVRKPPRKIPAESLPLMIDIEAIADAERYQAKLILDVSNKRPSKPRFARRVFFVRVAENNAVGTFLRNIRVRHPSKNATPRPTEIFVAGPQKDAVSVDRLSGRAVAKVSFDRELQHEYSVTLGLRYVGETFPIHTAQLVISVSDVNDNAPVFKDANRIRFSIAENATTGAFVGRLTATDADRGRNGRVTYDLVPPQRDGTEASAPFRVESDGSVYLRGRLDRETQARHELVVRATDHGRPRLSTTATATVEVLDINDSPPRFVRFPKLLITSCESTAPTELIGRVQAADPDEPPHDAVQYSMWERKPQLRPGQEEPPPSPHTFIINKMSGNIMVGLDAKVPCRRRTHNLTVVAFDPFNSAFKAERSLTIIVTENDAQAEAMRAMIFGSDDTSDSKKSVKEVGKTSVVLALFVVISLLMKMLKLMSCVAFT